MHKRQSRSEVRETWARVLPMLAVALGPMAFSGCAPEPGGAPEGANADLGPGARGAEVAAVNQYLTKFGYFPNPQLAHDYPAWRPIVPVGPSRPGVYDEHTAAAVNAFQHRGRLPETGIIDAATRALMSQGRCERPDGIESLDPSDKFAVNGPKWPLTGATTNLTWTVTTAPSLGSLTLAQIKTAVSNALSTWGHNTNLRFSEYTSGSGPSIFIQPSDLGPCDSTGMTPGTVLGNAQLPDGTTPTVIMHINTQCRWSVAATTPFTSFDLETVLLHEVGHALGLDHSSEFSAMFPTTAVGTQRRTLGPDDDRTAIGTLYNTWVKVPGCASDVGANEVGAVWVTGCTRSPGAGYPIFQYNASTNSFMSDVAGGLAVAVAVDSFGVPWVVSEAGNIFTRTTSTALSGSWIWRPGCARDIGVGHDGSVWIIGCDTVPGGHSISKWNGSNWDKTVDGGAAIFISVDSNGQPWVVNNGNNVFRRTSNSAASGVWKAMPAVPGGGARDIAVDFNAGDGTYAWAPSISFATYVWEEQPALTGSATAPAEAQWIRDQSPYSGGQIFRVALTTNGPWAIDLSGQIFHKQY
jgi:peptidoglycan hydrolase-like protein with peptidoglycan-binding domain